MQYQRISTILKKVTKICFPFLTMHLRAVEFYLTSKKIQATTYHNRSNAETFYNTEKQLSSKQILNPLG